MVAYTQVEYPETIGMFWLHSNKTYDKMNSVRQN